MSTLALMFWLGGMPAAYRMNRENGMGRISAAGEAFIWLWGLGHGICLRFYVNSDWGKE